MILCADCFDWLERIPDNSIHAFVTDPPYGVKEFDLEQITKRANGHGGIWRIPPSFDGHIRSPLPRFTALTKKERQALKEFFTTWSKLAVRTLLPGGHVFIASNSFLSQVVFSALVEGGLEFRGELIRTVRTLRGGDRPKNAEREFPDVVSLPRGGYEPWGIFRKPLPSGMTLRDCLLQFQTGGLRRYPDGRPFSDVILSERTPKRERDIASHPSAKPQSFMRQVVYAALPLGEGIICDPFMGSGPTVAAAEAVGVCCIGVEKHEDYYEMSRTAIPTLAAIDLQVGGNVELENPENSEGIQLTFS
jgi:site-specific DNA-methyltransferase (adenine-specific)